MWKKEKKVKEKEEKKETSLLKALCGDDAELYDVLGRMLYANPVAAIPKEKLETLIKEAEKSIKNESHEKARQKYRHVVDKAIFEATQHPNERSRYIKIIQDLASKTGDYTFMSKRIEDVMRIASRYYSERLEELRAHDRRAGRRQERAEAETEEKRTEDKEEQKRKARRQELVKTR